MADRVSISLQKLFLMTFVIFMILSFTLTSKTQERTVSHSSYNVKDIIEMTEIKVKGKPITPTKPFIASGNWLNRLTVKVKNTTSKPVAYIDISLSFPETKVGEGTLGWSITYGQKPNLGKSLLSPNIVESQEIVELRLNKDDYKKLQEFVKERISATNINNVYIRIREVIFADGIRWINGYLVRRDPQNPRKWIAIPKGKSSDRH